MDTVNGAYATLGLRRGCSAEEAKKQYRTLVKRWHPDRFAADPIGRADAQRRLSVINRAFRVVIDDLKPATPWSAAKGAGASASPERGTRPWPSGRPLTRAEIDAIVRAVGNRGPIDALFEFMAWSWPFYAAALLIYRPSGPLSAPYEVLMGAALVVLGIVRRRKRAGRRGLPL